MNNFDIYDVFYFDDDISTFVCQVASAMAAEEESLNEGRRTGARGSVTGHNIVNRGRKEGALRLYNDYFAENPKFIESQF